MIKPFLLILILFLSYYKYASGKRFKKMTNVDVKKRLIVFPLASMTLEDVF